MSKQIYTSLAVVALVASAWVGCGKKGSTEPVAQGGECYYGGGELNQCGPGLYCRPTLDEAGQPLRKKVKHDESQAVGKCEPKVKVGETCDRNAECEDGAACVYANAESADATGTCTKK